MRCPVLLLPPLKEEFTYSHFGEVRNLVSLKVTLEQADCRAIAPDRVRRVAADKFRVITKPIKGNVDIHSNVHLVFSIVQQFLEPLAGVEPATYSFASTATLAFGL